MKSNNAKNVFKSMRTPAVLVSLMVLCYLVREFLELLGMPKIASIFSLQLVLIIVLLITWTYVRYSGKSGEVGASIDALVLWLWTMQ